MALAVVHSRAIDGLAATAVRVEVHLANGLPCMTLVGLADTEVREARERVRSALLHSGLGFPHNQRITVNLAPADLPKESGRFDLPIAVGILAAQGLVDPGWLEDLELAGELSLAGDLRPVRGALATARAAAGARGLVLPLGSAAEASLVPGIQVWQAHHLLEVVKALATPHRPGQAPPLKRADPPVAELPGWGGLGPGGERAPDLRDVRGQWAAKRALEVAAAGHHSLLMVGPPGSGKSMLARRLAGLLPPLDEEDALAAAAVASLSSEGVVAGRWRQRPWRAPHHSAGVAALIGGGVPPRPGEISLAHRGVLFLDELAEFPARTLEALREPLETGEVLLARGARQARYPCAFLLVAAMNPCPCGWRGCPRPQPLEGCRCTPQALQRYRRRLSGPLLDRIDLQVPVAPVGAGELMGGPQGDDSPTVAARILAAQQRQRSRQGRLNAELDGSELDDHAALDAGARRLAQRATQQFGWSGRALHRALRVARTVADLAGSPHTTETHLAEAIQWRRGPLINEDRA